MRIVIWALFGLVLLSACGPSAEEMKAEVMVLEDSLRTLSSRDTAYQPVAIATIEKLQAFARAHSTDSLAPAYLIRAADIYHEIGNPGKAVELWNEVVDNYPDHQRAPEALFLVGVVQQKDLNDQEAAKATFRSFLEKYPAHQFSADVQTFLDDLEGRPAEQEAAPGVVQ